MTRDEVVDVRVHIALRLRRQLDRVGFVLVLYRVFYANYAATGRLPSPNLLAPFVALYIWWLPQTRQYEFYFLLVPLFHSLQYLAFAYKVEETRLRDLPHRQVRGTAIVLGGLFALLAAFGGLPRVQPLVGLIVIMTIAYALSTNRRAASNSPA